MGFCDKETHSYSLVTSSWFEKCFRFDIVNCLDRQKFTVHFFAMIDENLNICLLYFTLLYFDMAMEGAQLSEM